MKYLITGAGGTLGKEFIRQLLQNDRNYAIALDNNEWVVAELYQERMGLHLRLVLDDFINTLDSDLDQATIIHCAAYKHVDLCEHNRMSCWENNFSKTRDFILRARRYCKDFIFISTDKAVEPTSVYGKSKMAVEEFIKKYKAGKIIRFGNIFASSGSVVPLWEKQIEDKKPLSITDLQMKRYFIYVGDVVKRVLGLIPEMEEGQVGIPKMAKPMGLGELKDKILALHELPLDYPIQEIGIRRGEKLEEKLVWDNEKLIKTIKNMGKIYEQERGIGNLQEMHEMLSISAG